MRILEITGSPYEMGLQHGKALKGEIASTLELFKNVKPEDEEEAERLKIADKKFSSLVKYIPPEYLDEMRGIADGAECAIEEILRLNFFPEFFHCIALAFDPSWTVDQKLYHVRVLDYSIGKGLHNAATIFVIKGTGKIPLINIGYAGFCGVVSGMNREKIAIGEVGAQGFGLDGGMPMAFLLRYILENASNLQSAKELLESMPRTCAFYYLLSDGKTNEALGVYATRNQLAFIEPGENYSLMVPGKVPLDYNEKGTGDRFFLSSYQLDTYPNLVHIHRDGETYALYFQQPEGLLAITGYSKPLRYKDLSIALEGLKGEIDCKTIQKVLKTPVGLDSNLHNVIFRPETLSIWVANAGEANPAYNEHYEFLELLGGTS